MVGDVPDWGEVQGDAERHPRNWQERHSRLPLGAKRLVEPPHEGEGGWQEAVARAERRAAPVLTAVPLGGRIGEARRSVRSSALPSRRGAGMSPDSPAATPSQPLH
jgi:hypothetical protein